MAASPIVLSGRRDFLPACPHGKGKGVDRINRTFSCMASPAPECNQGDFDPPEDETDEHLTQTYDPAHDLRWILHNTGLYDDSLLHYINDPRFTEQHYRDGILYGVAELNTLYNELGVLVDYGRRYGRTFRGVLKDADPNLLRVKEEHTAHWGREELQNSIEEIGLELDYYRNAYEVVSAALLQWKVRLARGGDWAEVEAVLALGLVDEVQEMLK